MIRYVYLDVFFIINFGMNYLLLWATWRATRVRTNVARLMLASCLGALYALLEVFVGRDILYSIPGKIVFSALMIVTGFAPGTVLKTLHLLGYFLCFSFMVAGGAIATVYLAPALSGPVTTMYADVGLGTSWRVLSLAAVLALGLGAFAGRYASSNRVRASIAELRIVVNGKTAVIPALVDSGNLLKDPVSGDPVVVAEREAVKCILPPELEGSAKQTFDDWKGLNALTKSSWATRIKLIPYSGLGCPNGMLLGFKPDSVMVTWGKSNNDCKDLVVALCDHALGDQSVYRALVHPRALGPCGD